MLAEGDYVAISVRDRGTGISPELQEKIFDPLFTTKDEGTGLGLSTCARIIAEHRGAIDFESTPHRGTEFTIYLPAMRTPLIAAAPLPGRAPEAEREAMSHAFMPGRVLFVDDQPDINVIATRFFKRLGCEVVCVTSGQDAVNTYLNAWGSDAPFELVVMDMTLPGGMSGRDAFAELRAADPDVVCIASSGYFDEESLVELERDGFAGMLAKPFTLAGFSRVIENVCAPAPA